MKYDVTPEVRSTKISFIETYLTTICIKNVKITENKSFIL